MIGVTLKNGQKDIFFLKLLENYKLFWNVWCPLPKDFLTWFCEKLGSKLILLEKIITIFLCVFFSFILLSTPGAVWNILWQLKNPSILRFTENYLLLYPKVLCVPSKQFMTHISWKTQKVEVFLNVFELSFLLFKEYIFTRFDVVLFRHFNWDSLTKFDKGFLY